MRKSLVSLFACIAVFFAVVTAQADITLTVTNPTNTTPNLLASYPSLAAALTDLNLVTAMTGPVTLTLDAGTSETAPPTGFVIGSASLNAVLSATNTVTIVKASGTVTINAGVGTATPSSAAPDGMLKLTGADYITIDGITFTDGNVTNPATMEFGVALFKLGVGDGCNNNTIQNCTFNMQRINNASGTSPMIEGSVGILIINSTSTAATTALTPTNGGTSATNGTNSGNRIYGNTINSGNYGIGLSGYSASSGVGPNPTATTFLGDLGNDIGGTSLSTGNSILNYGGGAATSPAAGIRANFQWSLNISYNTVNNNNGAGVNHATTLRGIYGQAGTSANVTINNNTVTIHGGATTSQTSAIENAIGSTAATNTVSVSNNTITGDYLTATSGTFFGILNSSSAASVLLLSNSVTNMSYSGAALTGTGTFYGIQNSGAATSVTARLNTVNNLTRTGTTGGTMIGLFLSSGTTQFALSNTVTNITHNGTGTGGIVYGIQVAGTTVTADTNTINNISNAKATGTAAVYGLYNFGSPTNENYNYNLINNINHTGTGIIYGIYTNTTTGVRTMSNNVVHTVTGAGLTVAGVNMLSSSPSFFKNKIYNVSSSSTGAPTVSGLILGSVGTSGAALIYNNIIGDIKAPSAVSGSALAPSVRGINLTSATATSTIGLYNNSVYINATGGATFSTAALFVTTSATATTAALTMRNNALMNVSTPAGVGVTAAYMRSSTTLTNYAAASNTNLFYGGAADATHLLFYDGTNSVQTIGALKTLVSSREANSVSESPTFRSTTASNSNFLKVDSTVATQMESGGATISSPAITNDYFGIARYPNVGYPEDAGNPATNPDIGANEFGGIPVDLNPPNISYTVLTNTSSLSDRILSSTITDVTGVPTAGALQPRIYYRKNGGSYFSSQGSLFSGTGKNGVWNLTIVAADLGGIAVSDVIDYFVIAQDIAGPYITSNPSTGLVASDVNTVTTPPTTPNTYTIVGVPLSGDYTVGSTMFRAITGLNVSFETRTRKVMKEVPIEQDAPAGKNSETEKKEHLFGQPYEPGSSTMVEVDETYSVPMLDGKEFNGSLYHEFTKAEKRQFNLNDNLLGIYATLTAAVADVNLRGVGATDCRLLLNDAAYNTGTGETFPIIIDATTQLPTATSNLIIKPNTGVTALISTASTSGIIVSRAPYVVFDGTAVGNSGTRDMTIQNTSSAANTYVLGMFNNTAPSKADNNTIKYCNITGGQIAASTNAVFGIVLNAAGGDFDNCLIDNNVVTSVRTAIQVAGVTGATSDNVTVSNNTIGSTTEASSCFYQGIVVSNADNTIITQNELIGHVLGDVINGGQANATLSIGGIIATTGATNTKIRRNYIHDWYFAGTTQGYGAKGIVYSNASNNVGTTEISNNVIHNIKGDGDNQTSSSTNMGYLPIGICIALNGTSSVQVYNNSVYMSGATLTSNFNGAAACLGIAGTVGVGSMDVRNNLFRNSMTGAGTGVTMGIWVPTAALNNIFANISNNNYFTDGQNPIVGYFASSRTTLGDWQTASGQDAMSLSATIPFMSTTDLTIDATSSNAWYVSGLGYPLATVATDYTGASRSTTLAGGATDLGAYNVTPSSVPPSATESAAPAPSTTTSYTLAGKTLATLTWGAGGTPPTSMALDYFPGANPPGSTGFNVGNGYWVFTPTGGSGYSYDVLFNYNEAQLGTIPTENDIRLAKSDDGGALYTPYLVAGTGAGEYTLNTTANTIQVNGLTSFSMFGLADGNAPLPVELSSFSASINKNNVDLNWSTISEVNNTGFEVERKLVSTTTWSKVGFVAGAGNSTTVKNYTFSDRNLATAKYNYRLKQIDNNGNINYHNLSGEVIVGVPTKFDISQNYPNPFNPTTKINYDLPFDSKVSIRLFDMTGKEVAQIVNATQTAGYYTAQFNGANLASGVYFYNIIAEGGNAAKFVTTKKMVLVK